MLKRIHIAVLLSVSICSIGPVLHAQQALCPGAPSANIVPTNLACEIADATGATGVGNSSLRNLPTTIASQLSQLPLATAVSGSGLTLNKSLGVFTASEDSLGTILTQRGETIGKYKLMLSFTYQHFGFDSIDGTALKHFNTVQYTPNSDGTSTYFVGANKISLGINQYTTAASFGLTNKLDVTVILPFSHVNLSTGTALTIYSVSAGNVVLSSFSAVPPASYMPGTATGVGDFALNLKANIFKGEHTSVAVGGEVRFPTGDAINYLGTGAYGFKPYFVVSHRGRITPNVNLAYQWNGSSILNNNQTLPGSFLYSGGVDFRVTHNFTLVGEFLGQYVFNGPRLTTKPLNIVPTGFTYPVGSVTGAITQNYAMDNLGGGVKYSPTKHIFLSANVLFKMDDAGLRAKVIPLAGASYRF
jgi:hypothetical protein